jgi:hypothetical protein
MPPRIPPRVPRFDWKKLRAIIDALVSGLHPRKGRAMDFSKLTIGSKVVIGAGVLLLIDSLFHWQEVGNGAFSVGVSMWHGWGTLAGLLLLAILALAATQIAGNRIALGPLSPSLATAGLSGLLVLFTLIKVLTDSFVASWAWIGLVLSIGIAAGAWLNMQAAGESLDDLKTSVAAAASSATAAAKAAAATPPESSASDPPAASDTGTTETGSSS